MPASTPLHHAQILRTLPQWSMHLPTSAVAPLTSAQRAPYLDASGVAYPWYRDAPELDQQGLRRALEVRAISLGNLGRLLAPLQGITAYCAPLLQRHLGIQASVLQAQYRFQATEVQRPTTPPAGPGVPGDPLPVVARGAPQLRSLLEAALHNFEGLADTTRLSALQVSRDDPRSLAELSLPKFIEQCRAVDLGQCYQDHLSAVYDGANAQAIHDAAVQARQDELRVQVRIAALKALISSDWAFALHGLCHDVPTAHALRCRQLSLFGAPIHELLLISRGDSGNDGSVVLYLPHEAEPLREFASLSQAYTHMRTALLDTGVRQRLVALAPQALQAGLLARLKQALYDNAEQAGQPLRSRYSARLETREHSLPFALWDKLEREHVIRLKADARHIAVPTADVDQQVRLKNLEYWLEVGLNVLNIAALCVPALNPLMLALGAAQISGSVFAGISAWEAGDTATAMAQLESILLNVVVTAGVVGGGAVLQGSGFVDALRSIRTADGERLWQPSLAGYASDLALPDGAQANALGQFSVEQRQFIRIDGQLYEQFQAADGTWHVRHPNHAEAYAPALEHNGAGAWRLRLEAPLDWDLPTLLRRFAPDRPLLGQADLNAAWECTGLPGELLQELHLNNQAMPARLSDGLARLEADQRVLHIIQRIEQGQPLPAAENFAAPSLVQLSGWPEDHLLEVFHGSERAGPSVLYGRLPSQPGDRLIQISRSELEAGRLAEVVLGQLHDPKVLELEPVAADQRPQALQRRLASSLRSQHAALQQRLYSAGAPSLSAAGERIAGQFPGLPNVGVAAIARGASLAEAERLAAAGPIPLRLLEEARALQAQVRLDRALLGLYRPTLANADSSLIIEGLQARHPHLGSQALWRFALSQRERCAELIGQQPLRPGYRSPLGLSHGRLGYPLSGRGVPRRLRVAAMRRLQALYPAMDDAEIGQLQARLAERGDLAQALRALEAEHAQMVHDLFEWVSSAPSDGIQQERLRCAEQLNDNWRQVVDNPNALRLSNLLLPRLPSLSARFYHVRMLALEGLGVQQLDASFLECFPNLERLRIVENYGLPAGPLFTTLRATPQLVQLDLSSNGLSLLPEPALQSLRSLRRLRVLNLSRNRLVLDAATIDALAELPLDSLDLSSNGLRLDAARAERFQRVIHPQYLRLDFNPLGVVPDVRAMARLRHLSMANCGLQRVPQGLQVLMSQAQYQLREVDLSLNRIHELPELEQLLDTPFARDVQARVPGRHWRLNYNGLEGALRARLFRAGVSVFEHPADLPDWQMVWRGTASAAREGIWAELFDDNANRPLAQVLELLSRSAEARQHPAKLRQQVWTLLERAHGDAGLLEELNAEAQAFPVTCGDAGADAFSALEVRLLTHDIALGGEPLSQQLRLYRRLYRREQVNLLAERIAWRRSLRKASLQEAERTGHESDLAALDPLDDPQVVPDVLLIDGLVDDIEIRLALRQSLAQALDYPEPSVDMLYEQVAYLNDRIRGNVRQEVLRLDQDPAAARGWMIEQPHWQRTLRRHYASQFEALADFWRGGLDYLDYCLDAEAEAVRQLPLSVRTTLEAALGESLLDDTGQLRRVEVNSEQYRVASGRIVEQLAEVERGLIVSLTHALE
ncbi:NEL-type E3 ubiquitin ligase domain-containing protein [Pseudomonas cremoricolorata]|uniref:NEL-type E3 ubiquitin ligase domain-containing protein n=1 Tax=Pseudomonas cremoricolorata TaxID=157783 RepID=UPI0003F98D01|nr:NEL-type E3 ubiquitin ligase domain-containing protein [Pseudomonas cremoricolorata]